MHVISVCYYDDAAIFTSHHAKIILERTLLVPTLLYLLWRRVMDATNLMYELQKMVVMCTFYLTTTSKCFHPHDVNISPTAAIIHSLLIRI